MLIQVITQMIGHINGPPVYSGKHCELSYIFIVSFTGFLVHVFTAGSDVVSASTLQIMLLVCLLSYPYSEDSSQGKQYMNTRCPAWCDRILMSPSARDLFLKVSRAAAPRLSSFRSVGFGPRSRHSSLTRLTSSCVTTLPSSMYLSFEAWLPHRWKDEVSVNINVDR